MSRAAKYFVGFVGQSLNINPAPPGAYPDLLMANYPHVPWRNFGIGGASWTALLAGSGVADGYDLTHQVAPYAKAGLTAIAVLVGGTADLHDEGNTGAQVYADMWAYADGLRSAGFDLIVATTITPASYLTAGEEAARSTAVTGANPRIIADASHKFDYVVDVAGVPGLDDYNNATYYQNVAGVKVHWTTAGATLAATTIKNGAMDTIISVGDR